MKITLIWIFWPHCDLITCVNCLFFSRGAYFLALPFSEFRLHGLSKLSSLSSWNNSSPLTCTWLKSKYFYTVILLLHSHTYFTYDYNFFRPFTEFHAKLNRRCRNALYFMTSFLHWKIFNIFRENSSKLVNMFKIFQGCWSTCLFSFNFVQKRDYCVAFKIDFWPLSSQSTNFLITPRTWRSKKLSVMYM